MERVRIYNQQGCCQGQELWPREREVAVLVAAGLGNKEIAAVLSLSVQSVKNYVSSLLVKSGCRNRTELAVKCAQGKL